MGESAGRPEIVRETSPAAKQRRRERPPRRASNSPAPSGGNNPSDAKCSVAVSEVSTAASTMENAYGFGNIGNRSPSARRLQPLGSTGGRGAGFADSMKKYSST